MTTDLEQRLREALHADAERAHLFNPDAPPVREGGWRTVQRHRRRPPVWLAVAAVMAVALLAPALAVLDDDQAVDTGPATAPVEGSSLAELELAGTTWEIFNSSAGTIAGALMPFGDTTVSWDNGCAPVSADYELDRDEGLLVLTNITHGEGCGPPTTAGQTPHYPVVDAVMGSGRVPIRWIGGLIYLGDPPDGDYLVLQPASGPQVVEVPPTMPEPGDQPADPASAEEQVRATYLRISDTTIPAVDRAGLSERPAVWLDAAHAITQTQYWDLVQQIQEHVDEVVFVSPTHAVVRFEMIAPGVPKDHIGDALLVDGQWVMAIATSCELFSLAGVTCDMTL